MKNLVIAILIVVGLSGLVVVQYNLLKVGVLLEKDRFDQKMELVMQEVERYLDEDETLRQQLLSFYHKRHDQLTLPEYKLPQMLQDTLRHVLNQRLAKYGLKLDYSFALLMGRNGELLLATPNFQEEAFAFEKYQHQIRGKVFRDCHCPLFLNIHVNNLFNFLMGRLANLIIPSVLFILLLVICVLLLILGLNKLRHLDHIKNDFINNLTHELKTPVFSFGLITRLLREAIKTGKNEKAFEYLNLIEKRTKI